ncbi:MAG: histidine kinase [Defluviitaleaceae bacterium]|nr:histidine kinase [Defluviitaleaceae bacterium]
MKILYVTCISIGFGLLSLRWVLGGEMAGFFLLLFMVCMTLFRWRAAGYRWTVVVDCVLCAFFDPWAFGVAVFNAILIFFAEIWEKEKKRWQDQRDEEAKRYYELESLQSDLISATTQIERMTAVTERARIAREIHDNAGHEIVAAFISLQAARENFENADPTALRLYDTALERLEAGVEKIREAVHNLAPVTAIGVDALQEICDKFPAPSVEFKNFGSTNHVPVHIWNILESCLNETLTNAAKHAKNQDITVYLDTTPHIIRLCTENKITKKTENPQGHGLRNLRHRAISAGGSLSVNATDEKFSVVCVIPIKEVSIK